MNILIRKWLEFFIIAKINKNMFKFGQISMTIEIEDSPKYYVNVENVIFDLLAFIETKKDLARMFMEFEIEINDFVSLNKYESLENVIFTPQAKNLMYKEIASTFNLKKKPSYNPIGIWINNKWSDHIFDE